MSECVWSCSRSVGWVTGRIPRRSRRTHVGRRCPHQVSPPGVPTMCPDQVPRPGPAQTFLYHLFLLWKSINGRFSKKESVVGGRSWWKWPFSLSKMHFALDFFNHFTMGAILMKMAVFFIENAFCVGLFQSFYDGGDLDENGFPSVKRVLRWTFLLTFRWGRSWWKWLFSLRKMRFALDLSIILRWGRSWWKWFCVGLLLGCDLDENSCFPLSQT